MSESQSIVRYNYRMRPGAIAEARLTMEWDCARWVWNKCVEAGNEALAAFKSDAEHEHPTWHRMAKELTGWRAQFDWLRAGSRVVQSQTVRKWALAYQQALRQNGRGFPKFKSGKSSRPSLEYTAKGFRMRKEKICLAGGVSIPVVWSRQLPADPKSCVVSRDTEGHWNVSFVTRRNNEEFPIAHASIGIDWGVKTVATTTSPEFNLACGNQTKDNAQALKTAQRKMSRAKRFSKGYFTAKLKVSRIQSGIARQRRDRAFKWARKIVNNFGQIAIEDFKPKFLAKSSMAKKATDGAVGMTKQILIDIATAAKRNVVLVNPAYTTMTCASCGTRATTQLALQERTFVCESCGVSADRDENAARVIRARAGFNPTNVDDVRLEHNTSCVLAIRVGNSRFLSEEGFNPDERVSRSPRRFQEKVEEKRFALDRAKKRERIAGTRIT